MSIFVVGVNHRTAPVAIREQVAFAPERMAEALHAAHRHVAENLILSTCNRTEVYAAAGDDQTPEKISRWLADFHGLPVEQLQPYLFIHRQEQAVQHALRVACGLAIHWCWVSRRFWGQLKNALQDAGNAKVVGSHQSPDAACLYNRQESTHPHRNRHNPVSVAFAAVSLAKQIFSQLEQQTALLVGAGETIELVGHLASQKSARSLLPTVMWKRLYTLPRRIRASGLVYLPSAIICPRG
ncbi:MAG: hypothetical protein R3E89_18090 [Thiolinea sp.]